MQIFYVLLSQIRVGGMGGVTGVDYAALPFILTTYGVPQDMWLDTFERVQVLVGCAVKKFNTKKS